MLKPYGDIWIQWYILVHNGNMLSLDFISNGMYKHKFLIQICLSSNIFSALI